MNLKRYQNILISLGLLIIIVTVCVSAAPTHNPPAPPPTPASIPAPPLPIVTAGPTAGPPGPVVPPVYPSYSPAGMPAVVITLPTPASPPPPPPGVVVIPTVPTVNPTSNSNGDTSNSGSSDTLPQVIVTIPPYKPSGNPTPFQTLVTPVTTIVPAQTQTSPTKGAIAGPAAGGGAFGLVEPVVTAGVPQEQVIGEPEQENLPVEPDPPKSSLQGNTPPSGKDLEDDISGATSDSSAPGSQNILDTLRGTARNATAMTPVSGLVPPPLVPAVAVTTGMAIALIGNIVWANTDKIFSLKIFDFIRDYMGENVLQRVDEYEAEKRAIGIRAAKKTAIGLTHSEILVVVAGALLIGIASLVALRASFDVNTILLYVITGGVAVTVHEMGHRYAAHHQAVKTEVKFWELGTVIMFFTGWLAGNVFAQPHRTIIEENEEPDHSREGKISLAGPATSIGLAVLTVPFLFVGGDITRIASTLMMMTMLIAVYHLMPFTPMDGKEILHWNRNLLIVTLIPLMAIYYYLFLL